MPNKNEFFKQFESKKKAGTIKESFKKEKRNYKKKLNEFVAPSKAKNLDLNKSESFKDNNDRTIKNTIAPRVINESAEPMPLNKFVAHAGICGRREAAQLVKDGLIIVNANVVKEPGYKVQGTDKVYYKGKLLNVKEEFVYILLNKPKDYITTMADTHNRKTVLDIIKNATPHRVFPVGRLDRNTTGVLLFTNDGELTQKLTHPSFEVKKIYEVVLDKPVAKKDLETIANGIELEDGFIQADSVAFIDPTKKNTIGIEIHSGKNRIVRRIFEKLGYDVRYLDRVLFANLTKKNVERGKWRYLSEKEVRSLKFLNKSFLRNKKNNEK